VHGTVPSVPPAHFPGWRRLIARQGAKGGGRPTDP
jgi:hypothetical protein